MRMESFRRSEFVLNFELSCYRDSTVPRCMRHQHVMLWLGLSYYNLNV